MSKKRQERPINAARLYDIYLNFINHVESEIESYEPKLITKLDLEALREARRRGELVLVLGAGVSQPMRLLNWSELNISLCRSILPARFKRSARSLMRSVGTAAPVFTRFIEHELPLRSELRRRLKIRLYRNFKKKFSNPTLLSIVNLLSSKTAGPPVSTVITYNFDDILEQCIRRKFPKARFDVIASEEEFQASKNSLRIFHPHGFLPYEDSNEFRHLDAAVVFSESEFHDKSVRFHSWEHVVQNYCYLGKTCLFIGISFSDPNLRKHLDLASRSPSGNATPRHYAIVAIDRGGRSKNLRTLISYFKEKDLRSLGVTPLWVRTYQQGVPRFLRLLARNS